jgi:hypothetical protein
MKKKSQPCEDVASVNSKWNIGTGRLTAKGEAELLRLFGAGLELSYAQTIEEPMPNHIQLVLARLEAETAQSENAGK